MGFATEIAHINPEQPDADILNRGAEILRRGGLVAFPTETVYGLGANALDADAVQGIYRAKGRPSNNPLIVHVTDVNAARNLVCEWPETAARLAERFWPGPLTLVLPRADCIPDIVTGGGETVGIRVPAHPIAQALLRAVGLPLAAPSANRSLMLSPTRAEHVVRDLDGRIAMILDGGPTRGGLESTVINLTTDPPSLLRPGLVSPSEIEAVIGRIQMASAQPASSGSAPLLSPGMLARHYAPRAPLEILEKGAEHRVQELLHQAVQVGWLTFSSPLPQTNLLVETMPSNANAYASILFATLHAMDLAGVGRIIVELPPDEEEWLAVRDRLRRAAVPAS